MPIRTHDQRKEQQTVSIDSIDLIWSVASFGACHDGAKLGCGCGQASYASGHNNALAFVQLRRVSLAV